MEEIIKKAISSEINGNTMTIIERFISEIKKECKNEKYITYLRKGLKALISQLYKIKIKA